MFASSFCSRSDRVSITAMSVVHWRGTNVMQRTSGKKRKEGGSSSSNEPQVSKDSETRDRAVGEQRVDVLLTVAV